MKTVIVVHEGADQLICSFEGHLIAQLDGDFNGDKTSTDLP
jgi:hypothetical protein